MGSIVQVSLGGIHGGLVTERGEVWMFGSGQYGQLGIGLQAQLAGDKGSFSLSCSFFTFNSDFLFLFLLGH
jgi:alpha-tubulin suppressor-like RCC1 family protein